MTLSNLPPGFSGGVVISVYKYECGECYQRFFAIGHRELGGLFIDEVETCGHKEVEDEVWEETFASRCSECGEWTERVEKITPGEFLTEFHWVCKNNHRFSTKE